METRKREHKAEAIRGLGVDTEKAWTLLSEKSKLEGWYRGLYGFKKVYFGDVGNKFRHWGIVYKKLGGEQGYMMEGRVGGENKK